MLISSVPLSPTRQGHSRVKSSTMHKPETSNIGQGIVDEIKAPALVGALRHHHRRPRPKGSLAAAAPPDQQPFFGIDTPEQSHIVGWVFWRIIASMYHEGGGVPQEANWGGTIT